MKIYEIGTGYTPIPAQMGAATEIVVEELTRSLIKNGEDAEIIDIKAAERAPIELPLTEVSVPSVFTKKDVSLGIMHKLKRVAYSIALAGNLKKILKNTEEKIVLHFHNQYNLFFFFKLVPEKLRKKAVVAYTVHSYIWGTEWDKIKDTVKKKYFQEVFCVKNADVVFVLNDITAEHFTKRLGVDSDRIVKILNGVNTDKYSPLSKTQVDAFKCANGICDKHVVFQVGSVCERKSQLGTVIMLKEFLKTHRDVVYMYAGGIIDSEYQNCILSFAKENGISEQVIYVGELAPGTQLNEYYNAADCSVFTSALESFGLVIIEAISSGTPVVIGTNLMFELDGGYLMYHSEDEFVSHVESLIYGDNEVLANPDVVKRYSWDTVAKDYTEHFYK